LLLLAQNEVADDEHVHLAVHKTTIGVLRTAHDRFVANIEAGVDENAATGTCLKLPQQTVKAWIGFRMDRLHASGIIDVGDRRNVAPRHVELVDSLQRKLIGAHGDGAVLPDLGDLQHVRAVAVDLEIVGDVLARHGRCERAKTLAILDPKIEVALEPGRSRVAEYRAISQRPRSELHSPLKPADDLFLDQ
jgi:hypothetical protein